MGQVVAVERHAGRADALRRTAARMGAANVRVRTADAAALESPPRTTACSWTRPARTSARSPSRPDARWRKHPADPERARGRRRRSCAPARARSNRAASLVYSTCTISPAENERVIGAFLADQPGFAADDLRSDAPVWQHPAVPCFLQTLPHRDGTDGFFIARLRRTEDG